MNPVTAKAPVSVADYRSTVTSQIDARLDRLKALEKSVQANRALSTKERATLDAELKKDVDGLSSLRSKVGKETSTDALKADQHSMIVDYRVFKAEAPKIELAEKLAKDEHRIDELSAKLKAAGTDASSTDVAAAQKALDAAKTALEGQDKALLQLGPKDYAPDMFAKLRAALEHANTSLDTAAGFIAKA